jgi:hypothetical protein
MSKRPGRPSKRNPEVEKKILDALRTGAYLETAAAYAGIHRDTLNEWRREFSDFSDAVEQARAEGEMRSVAVLVQAEQAGNWRAAAWKLQHAYPERWTKRVEVSGELGLGELFEQVRARARERQAGGQGDEG